MEKVFAMFAGQIHVGEREARGFKDLILREIY